MRVLVTGGAGFIGSHVAEAALGAGHEVAVVDDLSTGKRQNVPAAAAFYPLDIRRRDDLLRVFAEFGPEVVSHQAAQASMVVSVREPVRDAETNVLGTLNVLEAARASGVRLVVFASTGGAIYGEVAEGCRADPTWPPRPVSPYAAAKVSAEAYLAVYRAQYALDYRVLRYANVYGPRQDPYGEAGVVAIFAERLLRGDPITLFARRACGDEGCVRDYIYVADVARANLAAIAGEVAEPITNVATGVGTTTLEIARCLEQLLERRAQACFAPVRPGDLERSVLEPSPGHPSAESVALRDGLARTAEWFRSHRAP